MSITEELTTYIRSELSKGTPPKTIQDTLVNAGWLEEDIKAGFASLGQIPVPQSNPSSQGKKMPWYAVPGYEGILNWKGVVLVSFIPFVNILYPLYLIVISLRRESLALFWTGFKQYLIAVLIFMLVGLGLCLGALVFFGALSGW